MIWQCCLLLMLVLSLMPSSVTAEKDGKELTMPDETNVDSQQLRGDGGGRRRRKDGGRKKRNKRDKSKGSPERQALSHWANNYLTEKDYSVDEWRVMFHSNSAADFFNGYARKISNVFAQFNAKVNFAMVGACDGTGDNTIKHLYLPNDHWRGVFVEPMSINVRDLITYMASKNAGHRSLIIRAAATSVCKNATLFVERPLYEEKNASIPHWLRRQIGSILPEHRNHPRKEWTLEEVRCVTARDILRDWAAASAGSALLAPTVVAPISSTAQEDSNANAEGVSEGSVTSNAISDPLAAKQSHKALIKRANKRYRRPHILKIDVEGHDFDVLMGFLRHDTPVNELPLIIDFEAKSIAKKYPLAKERMEYL